MSRVGRIAACGYGKQFAPAIPSTDLNDLKGQIDEYVQDVAELRLER
jgi:hypothetical protein